MVQKYQEAFQSDDVKMEASILARCDQSSVITEWHLMQALLGDDFVRCQFTNQKCLEQQLIDYAREASKSCDGDIHRPEFSAEVQEALTEGLAHYRSDRVKGLPLAMHMVESLYQAGSSLFRLVMNHFGYKAVARDCFDDVLVKEADEEVFPSEQDCFCGSVVCFDLLLPVRGCVMERVRFRG